MATKVATALNAHEEVEEKMLAFFNEHSAEFGLMRPLTSEDMRSIKARFERNYRAITPTKENPHMDDFMILDTEARGEQAFFVTHQGAICVNFAKLIRSL